jgi:hypothetical protein
MSNSTGSPEVSANGAQRDSGHLQENIPKAFKHVKFGEAFQLEHNGPVFVKTRGGFRPGRGGQLHSCQPQVQVIPYDPASALTAEEKASVEQSEKAEAENSYASERGRPAMRP